MGTLYLVRHGQASFGAADYDQLSPLGTRQCHALGEYLAERGMAFEAALCGSLRRQQQSLQALAAGHGALPAPQQVPGLNEYDGDAIAAAAHTGPPPDAPQPEGYRAHFRLLRQALARWMAGEISPAGVPTHADCWPASPPRWTACAPITPPTCSSSAAAGRSARRWPMCWAAPATSAIELNMRIRNSALTELAFTPQRFSLISFNHLPHLDRADRRDWVTHS